MIDNALDLHNFLGEFAPWIIIAVCIFLYSRSPIRASINVFFFFSGFVASYYLYSNFVAGFFPRDYALIWIGLTIVSPFLAWICWYAKGTDHIAFLISSGILGVLINTAFWFGIFYIDIRSSLNIIMLVIGVIILHKPPKETVRMFVVAIVFAIIFRIFIPFSL